MLSLMHSLSRCNYIKITAKDQHKMALTTPWEIFFYQVMHFGLKNARATYPQEMTIIFHDLLHDIMEEYMDDLLGKSKTWEGYIIVFKKTFEWIKKYKVCINPKKCVFTVTFRKIVGYIV